MDDGALLCTNLVIYTIKNIFPAIRLPIVSCSSDLPNFYGPDDVHDEQ